MKLGLIFGLFILLSLSLAACGAASPTATLPPTQPATSTSLATSPITPTRQASPTTVAATPTIPPTATIASSLTATDDTNTTITLTKPASRVACLSQVCLDYLIELGLEPVAVNDYARSVAAKPLYYGDKAAVFAKISGDVSTPNIEDIAAAKPDLVIATPPYQNLRDAMKNIAPMYLTYPNTYTKAIENFKAVGQLTGRTAQAEAAVSKFQGKLKMVKEKAPKDKTVMLVGTRNMLEYFVNTDKALVCGLLNEIAKCPWQLPLNPGPRGVYGVAQFSLEKILQADPEILLIYGVELSAVAEKLKGDPVWQKLKAVTTNQIYAVDQPIWDANAGLRALGTVLDQGAGIIYPQVFPKPLNP